MDSELDTLEVDAFPEGPADDEADDALDWDLDERDRYMAQHENLEEVLEIDVLVRSDQ